MNGFRMIPKTHPQLSVMVIDGAATAVNVGYELGEEQLRQHFLQFGTVLDVYLPRYAHGRNKARLHSGTRRHPENFDNPPLLRVLGHWKFLLIFVPVLLAASMSRGYSEHKLQPLRLFPAGSVCSLLYARGV